MSQPYLWAEWHEQPPQQTARMIASAISQGQSAILSFLSIPDRGELPTYEEILFVISKIPLAKRGMVEVCYVDSRVAAMMRNALRFVEGQGVS